jgi:ankyrin repeat protein
MGSLAKWIPGLQPYIGGVYTQRLLFVPDADNKPEVEHEISEPALFRFLINEETMEEIKGAAEAEMPEMMNGSKDINKESKILERLDGKEIHTAVLPKMLDVLKDIDKQSKIIEFETHQSSIDIMKDFKGAFHVFIVFKSTSEKVGDYWWSLEKNLDYIVLQRSRNKGDVKDKLYGESRKKVELIKDDLKGRGTIQDLFEIFWAQQMIPEKYHILNSNCQSFVTFISQQMTEIGYEYKGYFKYSAPPESGRNKQMLDLINILTGRSNWPHLFYLIFMGNVDLVDKMIDCGKYDINALHDGYTALHVAIKYSKTEMVQHLLKVPMNADPTSRDACGRTALLAAVSSTRKTEIIDLLLEHDKVNVDDVDENGQTALHWAAYLSNVIAAKKLIDKGADPNIVDQHGRSPLHVAAQEEDSNEIIDLLLASGKVSVDDVDEDGDTALYFAASVSNVITVQKLIKKGANPNIFNKESWSPLDVAATKRYGCPIIDLLLEAKKVKGMGDVNDRDKEGRTALHYAAASSNEITAEHLIKKGADLNCQDHNGLTPLHGAAIGAKDMKIIDVLLDSIKGDMLSPYRKDEGLFILIKQNWCGLGQEIGDRLLKKGIEPASTESDEWTEIISLRIARAKNSQEIDEILKEGNFEINGRDQNGQTPLFVAIRANNVEGARRLLERGADPSIRDSNGLTPFQVAVINYKDSDILNLLVSNEKVDINETTSQQGWTTLHVAASLSNLTAARFLLSNGANPNIVDPNGRTSLHMAAQFAKDMDIVELLLNHKDTNVNYLDNAGRNALDFARENKKGHAERIAKRLKEKGAVETENELCKGSKETMKKHLRAFSNRKPSQIDNFLSDGTIPIEDKIAKILENEDYLVSAIHNSNAESVRLLLKNGADISAWGKMGKEALHLASLFAKTTDLIDALLETGEFDIDGVDNHGNTPLHYAISGNNYEINVPHLIGKGADPNIADKNGITALHFAASNAKTIEIINLILENKQVDINHINKVGDTALHHAIMAKHIETARFLLEKGADPARRNNKGLTPFHMAAILLKDTDVLGLMLGNEKKIEIDERDNNRQTALHMAIKWSNETSARFLLSNGANPNVADQNGATPLHVAAYYSKDVDIVELLLNHQDVDVNRLDNDGQSALDIAKFNMFGRSGGIARLLKERSVVSQTGNYLNDEKVENEETSGYRPIVKILEGAFVDSDVQMTRFLIEMMEADLGKVTWGGGRNALHAASVYAKKTLVIDVILATNQFDINDRDEDGETALHHALRANNMTTARYLLEKGADPTLSDNKGITPLHVAAFHATTTEKISLILKDGQVDINSRDVNGMTPLHYAIEASNATTARYLLEKGANPTIRDNHGRTLFHTAATYSDDSDIFDLLLAFEKKIDVDKVNESGLTALHIAMMKCNTTAAHFLLSNGANPNVATQDGYTPLHAAAYCAEDMDIVELLLNRKETNVNYLDKNGNNALDHAMNNKHGLSERIANRLKENGAVRVYENMVKEAIVDSDLEKVRNLIEMGAEFSKVKWGKSRMNALHLASLCAKSTELLDVILASGGLDINGRDEDGKTALHFALSGKNVITVGYLLEKGADPTIANNEGFTSFHMAAIFIREPHNLDLIMANNNQFDIDHRHRSGMTALHIAIIASNLMAARFLLSNGANPNVADENGLTPLHLTALYSNDMDIVELLVNHEEVDVNYLDNKGNNALHCAKYNKHGLGKAIGNLLREKMAAKAEGNNHEPENTEALVPCGIKEDANIKTIRFLIENGQDVSALTWGENGANALHLAAANEETTELIDIILETGEFDINGVDNDGRTPLHFAIKRPNPVTINARRLIKMGADPGIADKNGVTPLHMAARNAESIDLIEILLNTEAVDVNCVDIKGRTPLACAQDNKHGLGQRIIARLRKYDDKKK